MDLMLNHLVLFIAPLIPGAWFLGMYLFHSEMNPLLSGALLVGAVGFYIFCVSRYFRGIDRYRLRHLRGTGILGTARVISHPATNSGDWTSTVLKGVDLHVVLPDREPYLVKTNVLVEGSQYNIFRTEWLPVWVDPDNPDNVWIDWDAHQQNVEDRVQQRHRELTELGRHFKDHS